MRWVVIGLALLTAGCASGYQQFYTAVPAGSVPILAQQGAEPTLVASTGQPETDVASMWTEGYGLLGYADFNGPNEGVKGAIGQAKKVGATRVVVSAEFARTVSGVVPMVTPTTSTTYTSGTVRAVGPAGAAFGSYNGTATTTGSQTTYLPYSVDRYDQRASFYAPLARQGIGLNMRPLRGDEAQRVGTNSALAVVAVRRESPAFKADILPGDYVTSINDIFVSDAASWRAAIAQSGDLRVGVLRQGTSRVITVKGPITEW